MANPASPKPRRGESAVVPSRKGLAPSKSVVHGHKGIKVSHAVTVGKPAHELYAFWRDVKNIAQILPHPVTIIVRSLIDSHWSVSAPSGEYPVEWDALIINDEPDRMIAWRSSDASEIAHAGTVRFEPAPGDEGTKITLTLDYVPPGGKASAMLTKISGEEADYQVAATLRRFKAFIEAGEIPTIEGQPVDEPQIKRQK